MLTKFDLRLSQCKNWSYNIIRCSVLSRCLTNLCYLSIYSYLSQKFLSIASVKKNQLTYDAIKYKEVLRLHCYIKYPYLQSKGFNDLNIDIVDDLNIDIVETW